MPRNAPGIDQVPPTAWMRRLVGTMILAFGCPALALAQTSLKSGPLLSGQKPWITILCRFADSTTITPVDPSYYAGQMFANPQNAESYWSEVSYNNITVSAREVLGWFNLPSPRSAYITGQAPLAQDCAAQADGGVDFLAYDGINFVFNQSTTLDGNIYGGRTILTLEGVTRPWGFTPWLDASDIAAAYPGRCNSNDMLAAYYIDADALGLANGLHTIGWDVIDDQSRVAGIGSRFFTIAR